MLVNAALPATLTVDAATPGARKVVALRGLPGSGKSTIAYAAVHAATPGTAIRINNDDLAASLFAGQGHVRGPVSAALLAGARENLLRAALAIPEITLIILDNTNLHVGSLRALEVIVAEHGVPFLVEDVALGVPAEECIARDARRETPVGAQVITSMAQRAKHLRPWVPLPADPLAHVNTYLNDATLPSTVIVDIDGTLALMGERNPFAWDQVHLDTPNTAVVDLVRDLHAAGQHITIMSGRDGSCYAATAAWLDEHVVPGLPLHMRAAGDTRKDSIIKHELFTEHVAGRYHVRFVLDDRDQVIALWRGKLGLPTFQVAYGNF
jgi:predicted kinase